MSESIKDNNNEFYYNRNQSATKVEYSYEHTYSAEKSRYQPNLVESIHPFTPISMKPTEYDMELKFTPNKTRQFHLIK